MNRLNEHPKHMLKIMGKKIFTIYDIFTCVTLAKAGLVVGSLRPSVRPSVHKTLGVPSLCNL